MNWLLHFIGVRPDAASGAYQFWSGFGSDLGELTLIGALLGIYRHHNCHVEGCARLGKHEYEMNGAKYKLCAKHHPSVSDAPILAEQVQAHHLAKTLKAPRVRKQA